MLNIQNISKSYTTKSVLDGVSFVANNGDKIAIVGLNGAGKSTLLKIIAGNLDFDDGEITGAADISLMPQTIGEMNLPSGINVSDFISTGRPIAEIEQKITDSYMDGDIDLAGELEEKLQRYSPYTAESEKLKLVAGFGIPDDWMEKPLDVLSGGQKSKVAFARVLYSVASSLLLDEPTNHLDKQTKEWVMNYIKSLQFPVVFISHDEEFLQTVANKILYIDSVTRKVRLFNCDYKRFLKQKDDIADALEAQIKNQQREIKKLTDFIDKTTLASSNERKRQAKIREKQLGKLLEEQVIAAPQARAIKIDLKPNEVERGIPIQVSKMYFGYTPDKKLIRNTDFDIIAGERFLVVGHNGMGKSTLLKLLGGILKPDRGDIKYGLKTSIGYYAQEHENLNLDNSPMDEIEEYSGAMTDAQKRAFLGRFNFAGDDVFRQIETFSPGERSRLSMAKLCLTGANLLLLDEPTNHLDVQTKKQIAETLNEYGGTMVIVSHDTEFLEHLDVTRMFVLPECKTKFYDENTVKLLAIDR